MLEEQVPQAETAAVQYTMRIRVIMDFNAPPQLHCREDAKALHAYLAPAFSTRTHGG